MRFAPIKLIVLIPALAGLAGCAGGDGPSPLTLPASGGLPEVSALKQVQSLTGGPPPVGSATEIYTRVARGVLTCWFGATGPLKPAYIYHAEAAPPSKGGASVIDIHSRDKQASDPRSIRAWKVAIVPAPEGTKLDIENFKLPPEWAARLDSDVRRWAAGEEGCGEAPVTQGWGSEAAAPAAKPALQKASTKKP